MPIHTDNRHRYPPDWLEIRARILERAGHQCECEGECGRGTHGGRCPERHGEQRVLSDSPRLVCLTIAHLDHTPEHNDPGNLKAMCEGCHIHYDIEHHQQSMIERWQRELEDAGQLQLVDPRMAS